MLITDIKQNEANNIDHVGQGLRPGYAGWPIGAGKAPQIKEREIFRTLIGLMRQGKTDFDHVREHYSDDFLTISLGLGRVTFVEILRQRFQRIALKNGP